MDDLHWMRVALGLAKQARSQDEVPVGCVIVKDDQLIGQGWNQPISGCDPSAHAEVMAIRDAAKKQNNYRLPGATLYVTIEPCLMCAGTMVHARIKRLVYGAVEPKAGVVCSQLKVLEQSFLNHSIVVSGGVLKDECSAEIKNFFASRRRR